MAKNPVGGRVARGVQTLKNIAKESGVSYTTIKKIYAIPGAPGLSRPLDEHLEFIKRAATGAVKLPPDLVDRMQLLKWQTAEERKAKLIEERERLRLQNLETRGKLVERGDVTAQGAAVGVELSSLISAFEKDGPGRCVGKSELELNRIFREHSDKLRNDIRAALQRLAGLKAIVQNE